MKAKKFKTLGKDSISSIKGGCNDRPIPPYDDDQMKPDGMVVVIVLPV